MREYKYLTLEEIDYYRSLSKDEIELKKDELLNSLYQYNVPMNKIRLDEPFHVNNGDWDGIIYERSGECYMDIYVELDDDSWVDTRNITESYLNGIYSGLDIHYIIDDKKYDEFYKIYSDKNTYLYNADVNCDHEIVSGNNYSGIKCSKCSGWYCA